MKNYESKMEQLELLLMKEDGKQRVPAKRVDIVSLRMAKESSLLYKNVLLRVLKTDFTGVPRMTKTDNQGVLISREVHWFIHT